MSQVTYEIVQHDGGWAYKFDGVFSEAFPSHAAALALQPRYNRSSRPVPGHTEEIQYEDEKGRWHARRTSGSDRPHTAIKDKG